MPPESSYRATNLLLRNPFQVIGATTRDPAARISELADEKALFHDEGECREASNVLINPRMRLSAEVAWMPGVSPGRTRQVIDAFENGLSPSLEGLPALAKANVLAAMIESLQVRPGPATGTLIRDLSIAFTAVIVADVMRDINEERSVASVGKVLSMSVVSTEIDGVRDRHIRTVRAALDMLPSRSLVQTVGSLVEASTTSRTGSPSAFATDIVDVYETAAKGFTDAQTKVIEQLVVRARSVASQGESSAIAVVHDLGDALVVFADVLRPIRIAKHARGLKCEPIIKVGCIVRDLLLELHRRYDWLAVSHELNVMLNLHFGDVEVLAEHIARDTAYLKDRLERSTKLAAEEEEFARSITYAADIGGATKDRVEISPHGFRINGFGYPLASITRLRWDTTSRPFNANQLNPSYVVTVGDDKTLLTVSLGDKDVFETLVVRLWRAVGIRILNGWLNRLRTTGALILAQLTLQEDGVVLVRHRALGPNEMVKVPWSKVHVWNRNGSFFVGERGNKRVYTKLGYHDQDNVPVLEFLIQTFFKSGKFKPSELVD